MSFDQRSSMGAGRGAAVEAAGAALLQYDFQESPRGSPFRGSHPYPVDSQQPHGPLPSGGWDSIHHQASLGGSLLTRGGGGAGDAPFPRSNSGASSVHAWPTNSAFLPAAAGADRAGGGVHDGVHPDSQGALHNQTPQPPAAQPEISRDQTSTATLQVALPFPPPANPDLAFGAIPSRAAVTAAIPPRMNHRLSSSSGRNPTPLECQPDVEVTSHHIHTSASQTIIGQPPLQSLPSGSGFTDAPYPSSTLEG